MGIKFSEISEILKIAVCSSPVLSEWPGVSDLANSLGPMFRWECVGVGRGAVGWGDFAKSEIPAHSENGKAENTAIFKISEISEIFWPMPGRGTLPGCQMFMFPHGPRNLGNLGNLENSGVLGYCNLGVVWNLGFGKVPGTRLQLETVPRPDMAQQISENLGNLENSSVFGSCDLGIAWNLGFGKVPGTRRVVNVTNKKVLNRILPEKC